MLTVGMNALAKRIRELRDLKDLSLREFARQLGNISPAHVSDIENGRRNPSDELLRKMAVVLGVEFEELHKLDDRLPLEELRNALRLDPALGFALRKMTEEKVSSEELLTLAARKRASGEEKK
ncbi:helix-turn-helix domain-containing protein [Paludibaculum fermentans]|uniref:helix-turn-helix domain-containing protein n=1 Tax=Paludibaculum fermentans TaxID=1473598 RepID=UPI003EB6D5E5